MRNEKVHVSMGHFTVVYLVAKPLIWSETEGDHIVIDDLTSSNVCITTRSPLAKAWQQSMQL